MIPAFDPGPNAFGAPRILTAGFGPRMTAVAGEVADGFLVHPVNSRRSLLELTLPALAEGAHAPVVRSATSSRLRHDGRHRPRRGGVRAQPGRSPAQLAFYGTTPAYLPVFELHGYGDLHPELKRLAARTGGPRWPG